MNSFMESFWQGLNIAHTIEGDKRQQQLLQQQAKEHALRMQQYALQLQEAQRERDVREKVQGLFSPTKQFQTDPVLAQQRANLGGTGPAPQELISTPSQAMQALQSGDMNALARQIATIDPIRAAGMIKQPSEYTLGQGDVRYRGSEVIGRGREPGTKPTEFDIYYKAEKAKGVPDAQIIENYKKLGKEDGGPKLTEKAAAIQNFIKNYGTPTDPMGRITALPPAGKVQRLKGWLRTRDIEAKRGVLTQEELTQAEQGIMTSLGLDDRVQDTISLLRTQGATTSEIQELLSEYLEGNK